MQTVSPDHSGDPHQRDLALEGDLGAKKDSRNSWARNITSAAKNLDGFEHIGLSKPEKNALT